MAALLAQACATSLEDPPSGLVRDGASNDDPRDGSTFTVGPGLLLPRDAGGAGAGQGASVDGGHAQVCSDAGCTCIRVASIGHEGIWGACGMNGDSTSAFETWLDTQSTATIDTYTTKPTLTPGFLAQYDVILLQWLRDVSDAGSDGDLWQFSPAEVAALASWVKGGGGLIALSGYDGDGQEVTPLNTLLSFTDFTYNMDGTSGSNCNSCWGGACALTGWNMTTPIGAHITQVGLAFGRSISLAVDAGYSPTVDAPCPGVNDCAVHEDIGKGHVFAYTDEWVTYTSQWLGTSSCIPSSCAGNTPADDFQVPQFWYNAIHYASSSAQCFVIQNPAIVLAPQ
jgi:hypothetical protein